VIQVTAKRTIHASTDRVFKAITDFGNLPDTNPDIVHIEFLSDRHAGAGTVFRETRAVNGKRHVTELEVREFDPPGRARMVADSHGTVWDSVFTVVAAGDAAELTIEMDCSAHKLLPKLLNPLLKGLFRKGLEKHIDAVKAYCEAQQP